jgi:hypothetical protein
MSVCCECCVLSGRGLCDGLITRPEESYRVSCVSVWSRSLDNEALSQQKVHIHSCCIKLQDRRKGRNTWEN